MIRLTAGQALSRLQSSGKQKAKGKKSLIHLDSVGYLDEDIFLFGNADGGVLCPAIDSLPAILGTWEGEGDELPPAMQMWLMEYAREIEWYESMGDIPTPSKAPGKASGEQRINVNPMLETKWAQGSPYNDKCVFDGVKCVTGCNATATAQILRYWGKLGYHRGCKSSQGYLTATNRYAVSPNEAIYAFDYAYLAVKPVTARQKDAIATMMEVIGRAFQSDYTPTWTGAKPKTVAQVLRDSLRMGDCNYISASKGAAAFYASIYAEIAAHRPVIMAGYNGTGGGHTFVCDGYDAATDMYHFNWGWGGKYDGWFKMSALNPSASKAYNSSKVAITGIQPKYKLGDVNGDGDISVTDAMQVIQNVQQGKFSEQADINSDGEVTVSDAQIIINKILGKMDL